MPRFVDPGALRRALELNRDCGSGPESPLPLFPGTKEETSAATVFLLMVRCCRGWNTDIGAGAAGAGAGSGATTVWTSGSTAEGDNEILIAR